MTRRNRPAVGSIAFLSVMLLLGSISRLRPSRATWRLPQSRGQCRGRPAAHTELAALSAEVARMENLTHRFSDAYLDLDLLDQQARDVLGMIRSDEIVIR